MSRRHMTWQGGNITQEFYPRFTGNEPCAGLEDMYLHDEPHNQAGGEVVEMRERCASCPLLAQCKTWAVAHERFGFWAGMTVKERDAERKRLNLFCMEPSRSQLLNGNWDHVRPEVCKQGHPVGTRDVAQVRMTNQWRWKIHCETCEAEYRERTYSSEKMKEKSMRARAARKTKEHVWKRDMSINYKEAV